MAKAASVTPNTGQGSAAANGASLPTGLGAPTERPGEPLTEGNPMGPGAGPGVLSVPGQNDAAAAIKQDTADLARFLPGLMKMATKPGAPLGFQRFVRHLRDTQGR